MLYPTLLSLLALFLGLLKTSGIRARESAYHRPHRGGDMQDAGYGLPRIYLLSTWVNKPLSGFISPAEALALLPC